MFGGLYLPHLREAVWLNLAHAEKILRESEPLRAEVLDFDKDGHDEVWVHSAQFSAVVAPSRGGAIVEYTIFDDGINYADVLTRRFEAYHQITKKPEAHHEDDKGIASIHHLEESMVLTELPPVDAHDRAILVDSVQADSSFEVIGQSEVLCRGNGIEKHIRFAEDGAVTVSWTWETSKDFSTEISLFRPLDIQASPEAKRSTMTVETVAKSEKGLDRTVQGEAVTLSWSGSLRSAELRIRRYSPRSEAGTEAHP